MIQVASNLYGVIVPHTPTLLEYELDGQKSFEGPFQSAISLAPGLH